MTFLMFFTGLVIGALGGVVASNLKWTAWQKELFPEEGSAEGTRKVGATAMRCKCGNLMDMFKDGDLYQLRCSCGTEKEPHACQNCALNAEFVK